uniref:Glycosyltransferase n=1 Tax=Crocus ancyrensis TaxID=481016 RepID=A0A0S3B072_9ASPA|nr:crocetin glucosyltransferase [Crocus ancyrensis]
MEQSHILLLPFPSQSHVNPMLQFGKRLASHNLHVTLANTKFLNNTTKPDPGPVSIESISDGFDSDGFNAAPNVESYLDRLESVGSETLSDLIESLKSKSRPVHVLVYDPFLAWAWDVADRFGLRSAAFFTQSCAVDVIYGHVWEGWVEVPVTDRVRLPGLGPLEPRDLPSYVSDSDRVPKYPGYAALLMNQYKNLEKVDVVLVNSFYELEKKEFDWMKSRLPVKSIGPTVPSTYLDNRIPSDSYYVFDTHTIDIAPYIDFLDSNPPRSVIYVSFGSMAAPSPEQTQEIASAFVATKKCFIWVVRKSELAKLPKEFVRETAGRGQVVTWCNQLDVLAHVGTGCFVTHCGWNSTTEGIGLGVPMVGVPQFSDQTTNAKYVEDVWKVGVRVKTDEKGFVRGEELERCIKEVMDGERSGEIRENAKKWSELAKEAISEGGSSDKSIMEFIDECCK